MIFGLYSFTNKTIIFQSDNINYYIVNNLKKNIHSNNKNLINICMALDNNQIYSTLVSMVSALENNPKEKNYLVYYILLSYDFNRTNIIKFEKLKSKYKFEINYYFIPRIFNGLSGWRNSQAIYYKLIFPIINPELKRILYLDGDTLIFKDLYDLYNLPFNDKYILGAPAPYHNFPSKFHKNSTIFINVGVSLINIEKIINDKKIFELLDFIIKYSDLFYLKEQDVILYFFSPNIGYLPYKYGIFIIDINVYKRLHFQKKYEEKEIIEAINNPWITHLIFCDPKVWNKNTKSGHKIDYMCKKYQKIFYYYAKKTDYYEEIYKKYM